MFVGAGGGGRRQKREGKTEMCLFSQSKEKPTLKTPDTWYTFKKYLWLNSVTRYMSNFYLKKNLDL